jgi:Domain of unknown function (DUF4365)
MSAKSSHGSLIGHRGELLAELFLQDLKPEFVAQTTEGIGYDFLVGFRNPKGGVNNFFVEVKATEGLGQTNYPISKQLYDRSAHSNTPVLLLVVDVKHNQLFYAWLKEQRAGKSRDNGVNRVELIAINESTKEELRKQLTS